MEKLGNSPGSCGFQYLIRLDRTFNQTRTGLDLSGYAEDDRYDLDVVEHYRLFGFSYYIIQAVRWLAEVMTRPCHRHRFSVCASSPSSTFANISRISRRITLRTTLCTFPQLQVGELSA